MNRTAFLTDGHVTALADWIADRFDGRRAWRHTYVKRSTSVRSTFTSLADAFSKYEWNGSSWPKTWETLSSYRQRLRAAMETDDRLAAREVCGHVLRWGGVWANNGRTLTALGDGLLEELRHVCEILTGECTPTALETHRGDTPCRMNAGFVKIYSVLLDQCVIYDGRVGAALGLLARQYCEEHRLEALPPLLAFAFGAPKESVNPRHRKVRDPSRGPLRFPRLRQDARLHIEHTMRANWFLKEAIARRPEVFSVGEAGFHELAAGLFMVGYDLSET